jgi:GAF domain-containing protein
MPESLEPERRLAELLGDFAIDMQSMNNPESVLKAIVDASVDLVPGARWAGVSLVKRRRVEPAMMTDDVVATLDRIQAESGDGPLFTVIREHKTVVIDDLAVDGQWPTFVPRAIEFGVHSMLCFRLFVTGENLGALTLYGDRPRAFTDESVGIGEIVAQHAAVALAGSNAQEQLQSALASRDVIGQAKGILMQRDGLTGLQAFGALTKASQETNLKLVDVARWLVDQHEGTLPEA